MASRQASLSLRIAAFLSFDVGSPAVTASLLHFVRLNRSHRALANARLWTTSAAATPNRRNAAQSGATAHLFVKHRPKLSFARDRPALIAGSMTVPDDTPALTDIEKRCLELAAHGRSPAEIVRETDIAIERVTEALRSATDKLGARNVTGAVTRALRLNLI